MMMKVKPNTKEQLVDYMLKHISLGTYDKKFCSNLLNLHIAKNNPVTSNQADLLNKIVSRYHRQLAKQEIDSNQMVQLNWTLTPIESSPHYTQAHIAILDSDINPEVVIHSPFKKTFVKEIQELNFVKWNREKRFWIAPATEKTIKLLISIINKHYDLVNYCPEIENILNTMKEYDVKYWNPTLKKLHNNFYVVACNNSLMEAVAHIPLNDEPHNLARLVRSGIKIDESVINDSVLNSIIDTNPTMEQFNIDSIINYLLLIKADMVILAEWWGPNKEFILELANNLKANNIEHKLVKSKRANELNIDLRKYEMPVKINLGIWRSENTLMFLGKNINLVNSTPIDIK